MTSNATYSLNRASQHAEEAAERRPRKARARVWRRLISWMASVLRRLVPRPLRAPNPDGRPSPEDPPDRATATRGQTRTYSAPARTAALHASSVLPADWGITGRVQQGRFAEATRLVVDIEQGIARVDAGESFDVDSLFDRYPAMLGDQRFASAPQFVDTVSAHMHSSRGIAFEARMNITTMEEEIGADPDLHALHLALLRLESRVLPRTQRPDKVVTDAARGWVHARMSLHGGMMSAIAEIDAPTSSPR